MLTCLFVFSQVDFDDLVEFEIIDGLIGKLNPLILV